MTIKKQQSPKESQDYVDRLADLVAEEQRGRIGRVPVPAWLTRERAVRLALAASSVILVGLLSASFGRPLLERFLEPTLPAAVAREEAQKALRALVGEIEDFRNDYNELPETLVEIGVPSRGRWTYTVINKEHYRLQGRLYGQDVAVTSTTMGAR